MNIRSGGRLHPQIVDALVRLQTAHSPFNWIICSSCAVGSERITAPEIALARVRLAHKTIYAGATQVGVAGKVNLLRGWAAHVLIGDSATICREECLTGWCARFPSFSRAGARLTLDASDYTNRQRACCLRAS